MKKQQCSFIHNLRREACPPSLSLPYSSIASLCFCLYLASSLFTSYFTLAENPVQGCSSEDSMWHLLLQSLSSDHPFLSLTHCFRLLLSLLSLSAIFIVFPFILISGDLFMLFSALLWRLWTSLPSWSLGSVALVCADFLHPLEKSHILYAGNFLSQHLAA